MQQFVVCDRCGARIGFGQREISCIVAFGRAELLVNLEVQQCVLSIFRSSLLS